MADTQPAGYSPTIRKRALARRLVELRKACHLTTTDVQHRLGWSPTKLNWIEKARWIEPVTDQVVDLCELYGIEGAERDALVTLAREARQRGWWGKYNDVFVSELPGFEAGASLIRTFETVFVPGLLQVPSYIELVPRPDRSYQARRLRPPASADDVAPNLGGKPQCQRVLRAATSRYGQW
jgi:hypothetical protein